MLYEAEDVVKYNSTDVSIWDRKLMNRTRSGETRLWWIHELGSQCLPMYCRLNEKQKQEDEDYFLSSVEAILLRFAKDDRLSEMQTKILLSTSQFYFITKGCGDYDYSVTRADFRDVMDLVFCGKYTQLFD